MGSSAYVQMLGRSMQMDLFSEEEGWGSPRTAHDRFRRDGTTISMACGREHWFQALKGGDSILSLNEKFYRLDSSKVICVVAKGVSEGLTVKTAYRSLRCPADRLLLANGVWTDAKRIKLGDLVAVPKRLAFGGRILPGHEVDLLALWLAEGHNYGICNQTPEIIQVMADAAAHYRLIPKSTDGLNWQLTNGDRTGGPQAGSKNGMRQMLERHGVWGLRSKTKFIPDELFDLQEQQLARFLNLFIACDGCICRRSKDTWALEVGLANERMLCQIGTLLHKFGIRGQVRHKVHKAVSRRDGRPFESWRFISSDPDALEAFGSRIGATSKERAVQAAREAAMSSRGNCNSYLPISHDDFIKHLVYTSVSKSKRSGHNFKVARDLPEELRQALTSWRKQTPTRVSQLRYTKLKGFSDGFFSAIAEGDVAWEEVTAVEPSGPARSWNLSLAGNRNFIYGGFVTRGE
ncbi:LAGLIDADG family homing endonuclease [Caballeronia sp. LZ029]|uniref:LAGLIDADG family homing endonuclease n=1 Tax=Caballeronia sp. LZ029 TaxID=3038564 RepID=UPI00285EAA5C|nr:LAGLIDADG family homing endonuclease [Caballeronia sp. LZ029]MDR5741543.1 LAGLIDADG family homing endonuclease [Caballeronia sp. LZ029]